MAFAAGVVGNELAEIDVLGAAEDIHIHSRIGLSQLNEQLLYLLTLRGLLVVRTLLRHTAGTAYKLQTIVLSPADYVLLADEVERSYELHTGVVLAVELREHRLHLRAVQHTHKYGLDHVVEVVTERYLVAAHRLCGLVKPSAAESRADEAGI